MCWLLVDRFVQQVPADVVAAVSEISDLLDNREYLRANDVYLRLAIGNAPWPMGVTAVGIHERSGREKLFTNRVARAYRSIVLQIDFCLAICRYHERRNATKVHSIDQANHHFSAEEVSQRSQQKHGLK